LLDIISTLSILKIRVISLCLADDAANSGERKSRLLSDGAIGAPFIPQPKHQALLGVVCLGSASKFPARFPVIFSQVH
jgi:hypothetical protein